MKIDTADGSLSFDRGSVRRGQSRGEFLATALGSSASQELVNEEWWHLRVEPEPGFHADVLFRGDRLWQVYYGRGLVETDAAGECPEFEEAPAEPRRLRLAVGRPSAGWTAAMGDAMGREGANGVLVITLEVGQHYTRQKNFRGDKEVELGTGYAMSFPWLTSLETPVSVLQLTGALLDRDGKAMRIGAEGILARRTSLPVRPG